MKVITILSLFTVFFGFGQSNTEVFLFDVEKNNDKIEVSNGKNISNNEGYDNQPSFLDDSKILFVSTRNDQTDIIQYHVSYKTKNWINFSQGGEYTPVKIPNKNAVSAIRLDIDGKQRLYSYDLSNGESTELIKDLVVAYYTWYDENIIVSAVIEGEILNLYSTNILDGISRKYATNVGRSFHRIPNSNLVSYISKENEKQWKIKTVHPLTGRIRVMANTMKDVEDICWLNGNTLLSGKNNTLYKLKLKQDNNWKKVTDLSTNGITNITRLSVNALASKLLIVGNIGEATIDDTADRNISSDETISKISEAQATEIVQKHIDPFNLRQLDQFANSFDADIMVNRFPNNHMYSGRNTLKENYRQFFKDNKKAKIKVLNRMILKNRVIDEELVTIDNLTIRQATIYEVENYSIKSMTFIRNKNTTSNPEAIVNKQLEKYNEKNIDEFVDTYASDIQLHTFPNDVTTEGKTVLRRQYDSFFKSAVDLNTEIVNRIVLGNKVIDKQKVLVNGQIFYAIAIYEVKDDLISKVTFIK